MGAVTVIKQKTSHDLVMAKNFLERYGGQELRVLLDDFVRGTSNTTIATRLGVTRQRVHQWKRAFTKKTVVVKLKIAELAKP